MHCDGEQQKRPRIIAALLHCWLSFKLIVSLFLPQQILGEHNFTSRAWMATYFLTTATVIGSRTSNRGPEIGGSLFIGAAFGLATHIACWTCLTKHWSRFFYAAAALVSLGLLFESWEWSPPFDWLMFFLPWLIALPVIATLEIAKKIFGNFVLLNSNVQPEFTEGIQFSIRHLLVLTTTTAVLFGVWNAFAAPFQDFISLHFSNQVLPRIILIAGTVATFTVMSVWSLLGHWRLLRLAVTAIVGSAAVTISVYLTMPVTYKFYWMLFFYVCWASLLSLLTLLRIEGYRFIRRTTTAE